MALLRLVAALAVMLLAVLPHATLAASAFHAGKAALPPSIATFDDAHAAHRSQASTPCHENGDDAGTANPSMPSCCILGCGLLGSAPALVDKALTTRWRPLSPARIPALAEATREPAERPPRFGPDRSIIRN